MEFFLEVENWINKKNFKINIKQKKLIITTTNRLMTSIWYMTRTMDDFFLKIENWIIKKQTLEIRKFNQKNKKDEE